MKKRKENKKRKILILRTGSIKTSHHTISLFCCPSTLYWATIWTCSFRTSSCFIPTYFYVMHKYPVCKIIMIENRIILIIIESFYMEIIEWHEFLCFDDICYFYNLVIYWEEVDWSILHPKIVDIYSMFIGILFWKIEWMNIIRCHRLSSICECE